MRFIAPRSLSSLFPDERYTFPLDVGVALVLDKGVLLDVLFRVQPPDFAVRDELEPLASVDVLRTWP